jgi:thymidylate synthase ThyX
MIYAKVIEDSINAYGDRLTTMEVCMHRYVLAEFNTHRAFSRNSASSRAIPIHKMIERVQKDPAIPIEFGTNQKGMQAGKPLSGEAYETAVNLWKNYANYACYKAAELQGLGIHKQVVNRLLEPFLWHKAIVSSTEWDNFFSQRCSPLAQLEINALACAMREALNGSRPVEKKYFQWHTPYLLDEERTLPLSVRLKISAARCARVSYLNHDGKRDMGKDIELFDKLASANPPHWSPMEHVACPYDGMGERNFNGWAQLRWFAEEESLEFLKGKG